MAESITEMVDYEERDGVGMWLIEDMPAALETGDLQEAEEHFLEVAGQPSMTSVVVEVGNAGNLSTEALEHVNDQWTELGEATEIDATAYVADGLSRLAISQKNEAEGMETRGFEDLDEGLEWAKQF